MTRFLGFAFLIVVICFLVVYRLQAEPVRFTQPINPCNLSQRMELLVS